MNRFMCVVLLLVTTPLFAQLSETVNVEVIQVPVYVVGPDGSPIRGLKKDAFELYINGFPKPFDYFDPIDVAAPADEPRREKERRLYLLLFDLSCSEGDCRGLPGRIARAQKAAAVAVQKSYLDTDLFAVATYTSNHGVEFATPFLRDRAAINRAITTLSRSATHDPLGLAISTSERAVWNRDVPVDITEQALVALEKDDFVAHEMATTMIGGLANQDVLREQSRQSAESELLEFAAIASRLGKLEGQKHVILFSQGFESKIVLGDSTKDYTGLKAQFGADGRLMAQLEKTFNAFQSAGVFLNTVDILGLRLEPQSGANETLQFLAHNTGGEFVRNRNDFSTAITDLTRRQQYVYLLGFDRRNLAWGKIDIKVRGIPRGSRVSFRRGFSDPVNNRQVDPLQLADIIVNDQPQTGVNMSIAVNGPAIFVGISRAELIPQIVDTDAWIETILYVFDKNGNAVVSRQKRIELDAKVRQQSGPIVIGQKLDLPKGNYVAKAITRIGGTSSVGFARAEFSVE